MSKFRNFAVTNKHFNMFKVAAEKYKKKILYISYIALVGVIMLLQSCSGIFSGVYDDVDEELDSPVAGQLYIDASDWRTWHYIDIPTVASIVDKDPAYNVNTLWRHYDIPMNRVDDRDSKIGIYSYWYDVFGTGMSTREFKSFTPTAAQTDPADWTIAVHRNNVRTNGCVAAATDFNSMDEIPEDSDFFESLQFEGDEWTETAVWCEQSQMLSGIIGSQGIAINQVLSSWLTIEIPPMPPAFEHNPRVFIIRLDDGSYGALQLENYQSVKGTKCCLTINYRYPLDKKAKN